MTKGFRFSAYVTRFYIITGNLDMYKKFHLKGKGNARKLRKMAQIGMNSGKNFKAIKQSIPK